MRKTSTTIKLGAAVAAVLVVGGIAVAVRLQPSRGVGGAATAQNNGSASRTGGTSQPQSGDSSGYQTYLNPEPKFSFRYPAGFTVSPIEDESGGTLLVRNPNGQKQEFQIRISEFDEPFDPAQGKPGPITPERIRRDIPDMVVESPQYVILSASEGSRDSSASPQNDEGASPQNGGGVQALAFLSRDESLGRTREVWFTASGYLYQITAYVEMDEALGEILKTWEFR